MVNEDSKSYRELHRPRSEFASRQAYLEHELSIMSPRRWRINLPYRDYRFEAEDWVPAMAATIGKIVMVAAIVAAFAAPLGLSNAFVIENARYEMLIAALLFVVIFSGVLIPTANLAGTHGPLIPLVPIIVASGGHPMAPQGQRHHCPPGRRRHGGRRTKTGPAWAITGRGAACKGWAKKWSWWCSCVYWSGFACVR